MALGTVNVPPKTKHTHTASDITDFDARVNTLAAAQVAATAPKAHTQAAGTITAGTFAGAVVANSGGQTYSTYLLRNTRLASSDTNPTVNGQICWTYK